jgi:putative salt-induced outer membrane protein YdiY
MTKTLLFFIAFFSLTIKSFAQDPAPDSIKTENVPKNTVKIDTTEDETEFQSTEEREKLPSWYYSIGLDGTTSSGNVNRQLLNLKTTLNFENPKSIFGFFTSPKFQYGTNSDVLQEREIFLDLNSTLFYAKHNVYMLIFGAYEQSNLRKIATRYNLGVGIGWKILGGINSPKSKVKLSISNAIVHEVTDFESKEDKNIYRNSTRLKFRYDIISEKLFIQSVVFLQPSLTDNYYRWNSSSQISYKVGKHIAILASFENTYENFNVAGIQNSQTNTTFGLVYSGSN